MTSGTAGLFAVAVPGFVLGVMMLVKTHALLRFRSPGTTEKGIIPNWKVRVWQGIGATVALLSVGLVSF
ncbi:hypothetical protein [Natronomonas sp.]|uniref:hypothetical protein n=1 Tax=Natronomonas sp. TaxID=2184060 RepID=UPI00262ECCF1|nr:hypothetical protein [Natronomonas sp.]